MEFNLVDDITQFGLTGSLLVKNEAGSLNMLVNNHTNFQAIIIISVQDNESFTYKLEPYIFEIVDIKPVKYGDDPTPYYNFTLESELSFIARTHHWVSVLKFDQGIKTSPSYEAVYECLLNYFKRYISVSSNKQFYLEKDIYFVEGAPDTHELVEATLKKIPGDSTIAEAMHIIGQDACTSVWAEEDMEKEFQVFSQGAIYVPMFFRDEYADMQNMYVRAYEGVDHDDKTDSGSGTENSAGDATGQNNNDGQTAGAAQGTTTDQSAAAGSNNAAAVAAATAAQSQGGNSSGSGSNTATQSSGGQTTAGSKNNTAPSNGGGQAAGGNSLNISSQLAAATAAVRTAVNITASTIPASGQTSTAQQPATQQLASGNPQQNTTQTPASQHQAQPSAAGMVSADPATAINTGGQTAAQGAAAVSATSTTGQTSETQKENLTQSSKDYIAALLGDSTQKTPLYEHIDSDNTTEVQEAISGDSATASETYMVRRHYFLRNMYMPFDLAFKKEGFSIIFESFNPTYKVDEKGEMTVSDDEANYAPMYGYANSGLDDYRAYPIDNRASSTFWKNMIFCFVKGTGTGSSLVYFDWIYRYYHYNFLKTHKHQDSKILNIIPAFYTLQTSLKNAIKTASEKNKSELEANYKDFCELNSNLFILDSESPAKEIQFHIGKMLASFVLLNNSAEFVAPGKLFRRPNEIIKLNRSSNPPADDEENADLTSVEPNYIYTNNRDSNTTMLYVRQVVHMFKNNEYTNKIVGNKIYDLV